MARTVVDAGFLKIANGSGLDDVANEETLHSLVLGHHRAGRLAEHALDLSDEKGVDKEQPSAPAHVRAPPAILICFALFFFCREKKP